MFSKAVAVSREQGIDDWRWIKKLRAEDHAELGQETKMRAEIRRPTEDDKDVQQSWKKRPIYTFRRKASNAGLL